jgi:hypothetical protein
MDVIQWEMAEDFLNGFTIKMSEYLALKMAPYSKMASLR